MSKGASIGHQNRKDGSNHLRRHQLRTAAADDMSEDLSDIDDAGIVSYLHNEKERQFKTIMWEIINKKYSKGRQPKAARNLKKVAPAEKAVKIASESENKKTFSSKVNYDVLKKLMDEHEAVPRTTDTGIDSSYDGYEGDRLQPNENSMNESHGFEKIKENDRDEYENGHSEESDVGGDYGSNLYYEGEDYEDEDDDGYRNCEDFD